MKAYESQIRSELDRKHIHSDAYFKKKYRAFRPDNCLRAIFFLFLYVYSFALHRG